MITLVPFAAAFAVIALVHAHPGESQESLQAELEVRNGYIASLENKNLAHCIPKLTKRGDPGQNELQAIANRRIEKVKALRGERGLSEDGMWISVSDPLLSRCSKRTCAPNGS
jgi:hypothetical protein